MDTLFRAVAVLTLAAIVSVLGIAVWYRLGLPGNLPPQPIFSTLMFTVMAGGAVLAADAVCRGAAALRRRFAHTH